MDDDSTGLIYSLAGADADIFDIDASTGQILTNASLNHEERTPSTYTVIVVVDDGDGGSDVIAVTITVGDVNELPSRPSAPTVRAAEDDPSTTDVDESTTSLDVAWDAPETTGPAITEYDVQYREGTSGTFMNGPQGVADTSTTIDSRKPGTTYQVRVKAMSGDEGDSQWSREGTGKTNAANNTPTFSTTSIERNVKENTPAARNIGEPITASDSDRGDSLTYNLDDDSKGSFDINASTGQLITKAALDHEAKDTYSATVTATDGKGATDSATVNIKVSDELEPPLAPSAPTVRADGTNPTTSLVVVWRAPANEGRPSITSYEVQYRDSGSYQPWSHQGTGTTATITELSPYTRYEVQVRAVNDEGNGPWASGSEYTNKADPVNDMPMFDDGDDTRRRVEENTPRGEAVGNPTLADDGNNDALTYTLAGVHADLFAINGSDGQILTKAALNHEAECSDADTNTGHENACTYSVDVRSLTGTAAATRYL